MTSEKPEDSDCIVISEFSDENGVEEKSERSTFIPDSSRKRTKPSESEEISDEAACTKSSSENSSKLCVFCM